MADRIQVRGDTAANWTSVNPTLAQREIGVETDTSKVKIGDGTTAWTSLAYFLVPSIPSSYLDTDGTLTANSDTKVASQKAVKTYSDNLIAAADAMVYKGAIDCSANPNYPAADAGHTYKISVGGKIGGASGVTVVAGNVLICTTDATASGDEATVGVYWNIIKTSSDGVVIGPASAVDNRIAVFDSTTGKLIKDGGSIIADLVATSRTVNGKALSSNITLALASADFANEGTTTTVLHGNAAGNPAFGAVVEADITLADNTTNDVSASKHGFAPKIPNNTTTFLRGDGTYAAPAGGGLDENLYYQTLGM